MLEKVKESWTLYALEKRLTSMLFWTSIIQFVLIVALCVGLFSLFPLKERVPFLVQYTNADQNFVTVKEANQAITADQAVRHGLVAAYVQMRETKNNIDDQQRYERVRTQSALKVWKDFERIFKAKDSIYQKNDEYSREVKIINVSFLPNTKIGQVDFQAITKRNGEPINSANFRAVLYFHFNENIELKFDEITANPLGFEVTNYALSGINAWTAATQEGGEQ